MTWLVMEFLLDANLDTRPYLLMADNNSQTFTKNELSDVYKLLKDNESTLFWKHKFTIRLNGIMIKNIDFAYNHYSIHKIKSDVNSYWYYEICIKIKNKGLVRTIKTESNLSIENITIYAMNLYAISTTEFVSKYQNNQIEINFAECETVTLAP